MVSSEKHCLHYFLFCYKGETTQQPEVCVYSVRVPPSLRIFVFSFFYTIFFLVFILLRAPLFLHVKLLCNYREDVGFSEQRGIPRFFFFLLGCRSLFRNSVFPVHFFIALYRFFYFFLFSVLRTTMTKNGGTFFLSMIQTFSMEQNECQKMGRKERTLLFVFFFWLCRTETLRLLSITDNYPATLIFWQRYLRSRSINGLTKILFDFFFMIVIWIWKIEERVVQQTSKSFFMYNNRSLIFLFLCGNHQNEMGESRCWSDSSCKDANVVEFFQLFGGGKDVVWLSSSNKMWKNGWAQLLWEHNTSRISFSSSSSSGTSPAVSLCFYFALFFMRFYPTREERVKTVCVWGGFWGIFSFLLIAALGHAPPTIQNPVASVSTVQKLGSMQPRKKIETGSPLSLNIYTHKHFICQTYQPNFCLKGRNTQREITLCGYTVCIRLYNHCGVT